MILFTDWAVSAVVNKYKIILSRDLKLWAGQCQRSPGGNISVRSSVFRLAMKKKHPVFPVDLPTTFFKSCYINSAGNAQ